MLVKEIIQRIQSLYSKGLQSDDSRLSSRHIYNKLLTVRSKLITQQANKKQRISDWNYQTIPCIEMIKVPEHDCPCIPPSGCEILRSKYRLPKPLLNLSVNLIKNVSSLGGNIFYSEVTLAEKKYKRHSRYTSNKPDYFISDGYLYLTHLKGSPRVITLTGLFEDPVEAKNFEGLCSKIDCPDCDKCKSPLDYEFPIDNDLIDTMIELSVKELIEVFNIYGREDKVGNNTQDDNVRQ